MNGLDDRTSADRCPDRCLNRCPCPDAILHIHTEAMELPTITGYRKGTSRGTGLSRQLPVNLDLVHRRSPAIIVCHAVSSALFRPHGVFRRSRVSPRKCPGASIPAKVSREIQLHGIAAMRGGLRLIRFNHLSASCNFLVLGLVALTVTFSEPRGLGMRDHLFSNFAWYEIVMRKFHGIAGPSLRHGG